MTEPTPQRSSEEQQAFPLAMLRSQEEQIKRLEERIAAVEAQALQRSEEQQFKRSEELHLKRPSEEQEKAVR